MVESELRERLLVAASLAVRVLARPEREDGTAPTAYESSGRTFANRIKSDPGGVLKASWGVAPLPSPALAPAPFCWGVTLKAGGARKTRYELWLIESPEQVDEILANQRMAAQFRASLAHGQRRKKPWGPL